MRLRHIQCQKLLRRLSGSYLFWLRCGLLSRAHFRVRTVEMDSLHRSIVTLSDFFNCCQAGKSDKGIRADKRLRIVTAMLRQVFCGAQGATLAFVTTATMLADALTKPLVHCPSLLAAMNARHYVFLTSESSTGERTTLPAPSEPANTQDGYRIPADTISGIAVQKIWSEHLLNPVESDLSGIGTCSVCCQLTHQERMRKSNVCWWSLGSCRVLAAEELSQFVCQ